MTSLRHGTSPRARALLRAAKRTAGRGITCDRAGDLNDFDALLESAEVHHP